FRQDYLPGINDRIFESQGSDEKIAEFLAHVVVVCLNSNREHLIANFPPSIEAIQDDVIHALRSYGFQSTADVYECYRWGRHWLREGAINEAQFVGNGFPKKRMEKVLEWNRHHHCETVTGLNEAIRGGKLKTIIDESLAAYESALDEAARKVMARINAGDNLSMLWVSGPSSS